MLQVTIKDTKTNEVIYDEQVSMVIMQAAEKDGTRDIRHTTKDASISDILSCFKAARKASDAANAVLSKALSFAIGDDCSEEGDDDDE